MYAYISFYSNENIRQLNFTWINKILNIKYIKYDYDKECGSEKKYLLILMQNQPPGVLCKKVFLEISQNSQENTLVQESLF